MARAVFALLAAFLLLGSARAQEGDAVRASRAELARAYLRFEHALEARSPDADGLAAVSDRFDEATTSFFRGRTARVIEGLDAITWSLLPEAERTDARRGAMALGVAIEPPIWPRSASRAPLVHTDWLYGKAVDAPLVLRLRAPGAATALHEQPLPRRAPATVPLTLPPPVPAGRYAIEIVAADGAVASKGWWVVADATRASVREANAKRLAAIRTADETLADALACCRARNALLVDQPSTTRSEEFLALGRDLEGDVAREIEALEAGRNPYAGQVGDLWREIPNGARRLRFRFLVPEMEKEDARRPLVVALHGMGGDENMFFEAYGAGRLKRFAEERGFFLVAPRTTDLGFDPEAFDRLLDLLLAEQAIDPERVYVLGHSLGAGVTALLATKRPTRIRAACQMAGAGPPSVPPDVPRLIVHGGKDRIARRLGPSLEPGVLFDGRVEVRVWPRLGHTIVVTEALPGAVEWLLSR